MRILLVEDDPILGDGIVAGLKLGDYAVDWVRDGESARLALLDHPYDACVLDLGLPRRSGLSVLSDLRARGRNLIEWANGIDRSAPVPNAPPWPTAVRD